MLTIRSLSLLLAFGALAAVEAVPQNRGNGGGRNRNKGQGNGGGGQQATTAFQQAQQVPQGVSTATDGSTILDTTANVKYVHSSLDCLDGMTYSHLTKYHRDNLPRANIANILIAASPYASRSQHRQTNSQPTPASTVPPKTPEQPVI